MTNRIRSKNSWQCLLSKGTGKSALCPAGILFIFLTLPLYRSGGRKDDSVCRISVSFCQAVRKEAKKLSTKGRVSVMMRERSAPDAISTVSRLPARLGRLSFRDSGLQGFPGPASKLHGGYRKSRGSPGKAVFRTCCQLACQRKCNPRQHQKPFPFSASPGCFPMSARTA